MKHIAIQILRILGYLIAVLIATMLLMGLTQWFIGDWETGEGRLELFGEGLLTTLGIALVGLLIVLRARSRTVLQGWPSFRTGTRWFGKGALLGVCMAGSMLALTLLLGGGRLVFSETDLLSYVRYVIPLAGCLLIAALSEEALFRGYPLTILAGITGRGWANLLMAVLFAAAHLGSAGVNPLVMINIILGSLVVGSLRFTPGGIPAAWGFHFAWNCTQTLAGATLSLENLEIPGVDFAARGSTVLSGGDFGPEAGLGATIATLIVLVLVFAYFRHRGEHDLPMPVGSSPRRSPRLTKEHGSRKPS